MALSTYRTTLLASLALSIPSFVLIYFWLREGVKATDNGVVITPAKPDGGVLYKTYNTRPRRLRRVSLRGAASVPELEAACHRKARAAFCWRMHL